MPELYWIVPLEGGRPGNALPGGPPGHVGGGPVYPGGPVDPGYGRPIYHPGHPDHGLPSYPGRPDNSLPGGVGVDNSLPGGEPVPPDVINPPLPDQLPEPYGDKVVVAVKRPGEEWRVTAYEANTFPDQGLPPSAQPK